MLSRGMKKNQIFDLLSLMPGGEVKREEFYKYLSANSFNDVAIINLGNVPEYRYPHTEIEEKREEVESLFSNLDEKAAIRHKQIVSVLVQEIQFYIDHGLAKISQVARLSDRYGISLDYSHYLNAIKDAKKENHISPCNYMSEPKNGVEYVEEELASVPDGTTLVFSLEEPGKINPVDQETEDFFRLKTEQNELPDDSPEVYWPDDDIAYIDLSNSLIEKVKDEMKKEAFARVIIDNLALRIKDPDFILLEHNVLSIEKKLEVMKKELITLNKGTGGNNIFVSLTKSIFVFISATSTISLMVYALIQYL
jgi:hypothetical protein